MFRMHRSDKFLTWSLECAVINTFLMDAIDSPLVKPAQASLFHLTKEQCQRLKDLSDVLETIIGDKDYLTTNSDLLTYDTLVAVKERFKLLELRQAIVLLKELSSNTWDKDKAEELLNFIGEIQTWAIGRHSMEYRGCF